MSKYQSPNCIMAKKCVVEGASYTDGLKDIHIGVFFDGTANNMVSQATYNGFFNMSLFGLNAQKSCDDSKKIQDMNLKRKKQALKIKALELSAVSLTSQGVDTTSIYKIIGLEKQKLMNYDEKLEKAASEFKITEKELYDHEKIIDKGYSNIAILYSLFNNNAFGNSNSNDGENKLSDQTYLSHKIYIEGSGAAPVETAISKNVNGLGFGLGLTGVTALVSKAVRRVTEYIGSLGSKIEDNTKLHFYIYGFSRGATCARLFSHLITREIDEEEKKSIPIKRESEFKAFLPQIYFENECLYFVKKCLQKSATKLKANNICIEILGIYDTVVSIGLLKREDGWTNPLGEVYKDKPNYKKNWHYKNVNEYGLYLSKNKNVLKKVIHIGALDEFRENFAFTDIGKTIQDNAIEILMPGCHSDVGGGYVTGVEQEISLPLHIGPHHCTRKIEKINDEGNRTRIIPHKYIGGSPRKIVITDNKPKLYITNQESDIDCNANAESLILNRESLTYLGWIQEDNKNKKDQTDKKRQKKKQLGSRWTLTVKEHDHYGWFKVIYFKRFVKRGWSDVALQMMINLTKNRINISLFNNPEVYAYDKTIDDVIVKGLAIDLLNKIANIADKKRYLITIGDDISSPNYKYLRLRYIHFTSTCSLGHVVNFLDNNSIYEGDFGNFGNYPNFDSCNRLCRINYHGDINAKAGDDDYMTEVNYLDQLLEDATRININ